MIFLNLNKFLFFNFILMFFLFFQQLKNNDLLIFLVEKQPNKIVYFNSNVNLLHIDIEKENPIIINEKIYIYSVNIFFFWKDFDLIYSINKVELETKVI